MVGTAVSRKRARDGATGLVVQLPEAPRKPQAYQFFLKGEMGAALLQANAMMQADRLRPAEAGQPAREGAGPAGPTPQEAWAALDAAHRAPYETAAVAEYARRVGEWDRGFPDRNAARLAACSTLGVDATTHWDTLVQVVQARNAVSECAAAAAQKRPKPTAPAAPAEAVAMAESPGGSAAQRRAMAAKSRAWQTCWHGARRLKAALRGLDAVLALASNAAHGDQLGDQGMRCLADVAAATADPVRARALDYVARLARRRKCAAGPPQDLAAALASVRALDRAGVSSARLKDELRFALASRAPGGAQKANASAYRALCDDLVSSSHAERAGLGLGLSYGDALRRVGALRPYRSPGALSFEDYADQCDVVALVVLTLNDWGALRISPQLLSHEYCFVREHFAGAVRGRDAKRVGDFVRCLRCFGATDADALVQLGTSFLLGAQDEATGRWDAQADASASSRTTMVAVQALLVHSFRGEGPGLASAIPVLAEWHAADPVEANAEAKPREKPPPAKAVARKPKAPPKTPPAPSPAAAPAARAAPPKAAPEAAGAARGGAPAAAAHALTAAFNVSKPRAAAPLGAAAAVAGIEARLAAACEASAWPAAAALLRELSKIDIDVGLLQATTIGKTVASLKKADDPKLKATARALVARWKQLVVVDNAPAPAAGPPGP
ncbi:hypothetical protein M885DRAFT_566094 [Pelagophyceae sp. CCMP2097]|nr:hypothetical protein M885DRAFT_566094 [Pelagophyceae sp. CCMP2097]